MQHLDLLRRVAGGELSPEDAAALLRAADVAELGGIARLDVGRAARLGIPEVVLAGPKHPAEVAAIAATILDRIGRCLVSRLRARHRRALQALAEDSGATLLMYGSRAALLLEPGVELPAPGRGLVGLIAAGTSDLDALAEARMVLDATGVASRTVADVGVAGLHRLFTPLAALVRDGADAIVVAAGMDGALASVVTGLAGVPVIGLPTSTGYGVGGRGRAALLAMLQGCAPGLVVVNVDNGVGAGAAAALVAMRHALPSRVTAAAGSV
ncbi:MAG TPA: nickel pincer cofactor biosynthesis protein LarB [Candidatus Dormibacteraeota bacterium]